MHEHRPPILIIIIFVDENNISVEDDKKGVNGYKNNHCNSCPVLLKCSQCSDRIVEHTVCLVPLNDEYEGDNTQQVASPVSIDTIPDPGLHRPFVIDKAPYVRHYTD